MDVTGLGTYRLARSLRRLGVRRIVMVSGMDVYGHINVDTVNHHTPPRFQRPYGLAKWAAESFLFETASETRAVSVRSPAILGPRHRRHFLARTLQSMRDADETVCAHSPNFHFNNAVHEETLSNFLVRLALEDPFPDVQALTVGATQPRSMRDILEILSARSRYRGRISWTTPDRHPFNIDFGHSLLFGFEPTPLTDALERWLSEINLAQ